jgi:hypothetical protein
MLWTGWLRGDVRHPESPSASIPSTDRYWLLS